MLLSKVLKNLKKIENKKSSDLSITLGGLKKPSPQRDGFHAKVII